MGGRGWRVNVCESRCGSSYCAMGPGVQKLDRHATMLSSLGSARGSATRFRLNCAGVMAGGRGAGSIAERDGALGWDQRDAG